MIQMREIRKSFSRPDGGRLQVLKGNTPRVRLKGAFFYVSVRDPGNRQSIRDAMQEWYTDHAKALLLRRLERYLPHIRRRGAKEPIVRFRRMSHRWGSCCPKGTIMLNTELVKMPISCIDYVLVHELCHLQHLRHNGAFFALLTRLLPDWQERKERIERAGCSSI